MVVGILDEPVQFKSMDLVPRFWWLQVLGGILQRIVLMIEMQYTGYSFWCDCVVACHWYSTVLANKSNLPSTSLLKAYMERVGRKH